MMGRTKHTQIVSATPGRTRIKVSPKRRNPEEMQRISHKLEEKPRVREVRTDIRTGSIVVRHDRDALGDIEQTFKDLGVILASTLDVDIPTAEGESDLASGLAGAVEDLNRRLGFAADGLINLRTLVPLGFGALALVQLVRRGLQIEAAPWYVLAYLAYDSFVKLNYAPGKANPQGP